MAMGHTQNANEFHGHSVLCSRSVKITAEKVSRGMQIASSSPSFRCRQPPSIKQNLLGDYAALYMKSLSHLPHRYGPVWLQLHSNKNDRVLVGHAQNAIFRGTLSSARRTLTLSHAVGYV